MREKHRSVGLSFGVLLLACGLASAQGAPPLPGIGIEGYGGIFATYSAYLVNPSPEDEVFGLPSVAAIYVNLGKDRHLGMLGVTETLWGPSGVGLRLRFLGYRRSHR